MKPNSKTDRNISFSDKNDIYIFQVFTPFINVYKAKQYLLASVAFWAYDTVLASSHNTLKLQGSPDVVYSQYIN